MLEFPCKRFLNHGMTGTPKLLTEPEIAEILRCRVSEVARLRERGYLPYIYGKPILIDEADLLAVVGNSPLLTGAQVSRRLGITRDRLRYWRDTGRISCCPLPLSRTKYREEDLQAHFVAEEAKRVREAAIMVANEKFKAEQAAEKAKGKRLKPTPVQRKARRKALALIPRLRRQPNGVYHMEWREEGRTKTVSTRTRDWCEALAVHRKWLKETGVWARFRSS